MRRIGENIMVLVPIAIGIRCWVLVKNVGTWRAASELKSALIC